MQSNDWWGSHSGSSFIAGCWDLAESDGNSDNLHANSFLFKLLILSHTSNSYLKGGQSSIDDFSLLHFILTTMLCGRVRKNDWSQLGMDMNQKKLRFVLVCGSWFYKP